MEPGEQIEPVEQHTATKTNEKLGDRMKKFESMVDNQIMIKPCESFIIRLDGRSFSKFTKKFHKPFDIVFVKAMGLTTLDLVKQFEAQTGYTHSDEITLIFNSKSSEDEYLEYLEKQSKNLLTKDDKDLPIHMFNGRIQKILSLVSSYCSVRFNYHLIKLIEPIKESYDTKFVETIESMNAMFDGRILIFQESAKYEILNHQIWRSIYDCSRNAVSTYAHTYFGPQKIMNKDTKQMIQMMMDEKGLDWSDTSQVPTFIKHGLYCKKIMVNKVIDGNPALRAEYIFKQHKIDFSQENLDILLAKYWTDVESWGGQINLNEITIQSN